MLDSFAAIAEADTDDSQDHQAFQHRGEELEVSSTPHANVVEKREENDD